MNAHLLSLAALYAEDPSAPDAVFGPDGGFEGAPLFSPPIWLCRADRPDAAGWVDWRTEGVVGMYQDELCLHWSDYTIRPLPLSWLFLDCRVRSVRLHLIWLCSRVQDVDPNMSAEDITALTITLAAALGRNARLVAPKED